MFNDGHKGKTLDPIKRIFLKSQILVKLSCINCSDKEEKKMTDKKGHPVHVVD